MRNSVAHIKAKAFAVRIVKFTQFLQKRRKSVCYQSRYCVAEQV